MFESANVVTKDGATSVVINYTEDGESKSKWFNNYNDIEAAVRMFIDLYKVGLI